MEGTGDERLMFLRHQSSPLATACVLLGVGECQLKPTIEDVRASMDWSVHVSFPFFNHPDVGDVDDGKFLPVIQHPGSTFLHMSPDESKAVEKQMRQVLAVIPFVIILSLFIIISGIIVWVLVSCNSNFMYFFSFTVHDICT